MSIRDRVNSDSIDIEKETNRKQTLGKIADLLEKQGIDLDEVGTIKRVSLYQSLIKNDEGEAEIHDLTAIQFSPKWADGPEWPVVQQGPAVKVPKVKATPSTKSTSWKQCVVFPDVQIGYFKNAWGELEPTHDEDAIDIALAITKSVNPDLVVCVGDNLDLPEMSKYRLTPAYAQTTQATIDRATTFCAQLKAAAPNARIVWLAGNHEERMPNYILDNASAAYGLKQGLTPNSWPVLSVPYLCRMEEFDIEYKPGYPASNVWINERLRVIHGDRVKSSGSTVHQYLDKEKSSVIFGHIHRVEVAYRTREDHDGAKTILAASPGCLARIDGAIPSTKGGTDLDGRPLVRYENWQQGLAVISYEEDGLARFNYEQVMIIDGCALWRGKEYNANPLEVEVEL